MQPSIILQFMQSRSYCWTYFGQKTPDEVKSDLNDSGFVRYGIFQKEVCPDTQRAHLQGYCEFDRPIRLARFQRILPGVHCERRRGSRNRARNYCRKEDTRIDGPWEIGEWEAGGQGRRTDLTEIKARIEDGAGPRQIADEYFNQWVVYRRSFAAYRDLLQQPRQHITEVHILWGEAGSGKTRHVWELGLSVYPLPHPNGGSVWFDGYNGEQVLLLDDFYGWIPVHLLLKLGDRYPLRVPIKGGMTQFVSTKLYITSNKPWSDWYKWDELGHELKQAFNRRITTCVHMINER